jgi:hypothetical protein
MIVLSTLRYGEEAYGSASSAVLRQLSEVHHKDVRLALGTFVICRMENLLCESGLAKLDEIRKLTTQNRRFRYTQIQTIFQEPEQTGRVCDAAKKPTNPVYKNSGVHGWNTN